MALPDWSIVPDDGLRAWAQAQTPGRQTILAGLRDDAENFAQFLVLLDLRRQNDEIADAIASTGSLSAEELAMDEMEFYQYCVKRSQQNYENEKAAARAARGKLVN